MADTQPANRYSQIIEKIFHRHFQSGAAEVPFAREEIVETAQELGITLPKNLGDLIYSFRYRAELPLSIQKTAPEGKIWVIRPAGRALYKFAAIGDNPITPNPHLAETKIADSTPGMVGMYALSDEQSLLAKLRYNRLLDIFTGIACYSLQNHLRTTVPNMGQIETDEIYVGVDSRGVHFVLPVEAKGGSDRLSIVQIEQDYALCSHKFPELVCRPVAAQFIDPTTIALFLFEETDQGLRVTNEKHYKLVPPDKISSGDLDAYKARAEG